VAAFGCPLTKAQFVEFEWSTAIALRKSIIPCLLDKLPLPPSLSSYNSITLNSFEKDLPRTLESFSIPERSSDSDHNTEILQKLDQLSPERPDEAIGTMRDLIKQDASSVQGNVYQAGGDISIGHREETKGTPLKRILEKWHFVVAILVGLLTIIQISKKEFFNDGVPVAGNAIMEEQILAGFIQEASGAALSGVTVIISEYNLRDTTDLTGRFEFKVEDAPKEAPVQVRVMHNGRFLDWKEATLGNRGCDFLLRNPL
jgi:hypothetical protein